MSTYTELAPLVEETPPKSIIPCDSCINTCKGPITVNGNTFYVLACDRHIGEEAAWITRMGTDMAPVDAKVVKWMRRELTVYRDQSEFYHDVIRQQRKHIAELERRLEAVTIANAIIRVKIE